MRKLSFSAAAAAGLLAGGLYTGSVHAADLGGNCCADLEERIAELEATTVRKGNRKVSLTISGWVAEQVVFWDDGVESNAYVTGVGTTLSSHFKMTGAAQISPGVSAGYVIHVETQNVDPFAVDQNRDDATLNANSVSLLQSYWFLKSDTLGKLSVGQQSHASDNTAILVDGSGSLVPANWLIIEGTSFFLRSNGLTSSGGTTGTAGDLRWGDVHHCGHTSLGIAADCNGVPNNAVRYDSPTFGGFSVSASWGEDDFWDVAARYAGEFGGFKLAIAGAYSQNTDEGGALGVLRRDSDYYQIGAYLQHVPSGLFVYGAYGHEDNNNITPDPIGDGNGGEIAQPNNDHWYIKAGIRQRFAPLGHTVIYGEYGQYKDMVSPFLLDLSNATVAADSVSTIWGAGLVQEIDAAAMSLWLTYRNIDGEITMDGVNNDLDQLHVIKAGALINF